MQEINNFYLKVFFLPTLKEGQSLSPRRLRMLIITIQSLHPGLLYLKASTEMPPAYTDKSPCTAFFRTGRSLASFAPWNYIWSSYRRSHKYQNDNWDSKSQEKKPSATPCFSARNVPVDTKNLKNHFLINCFPGCFSIGFVLF